MYEKYVPGRTSKYAYDVKTLQLIEFSSLSKQFLRSIALLVMKTEFQHTVARNLIFKLAVPYTRKAAESELTSQKNVTFVTSKVKTKCKFNHRPFISGYRCTGTPSFALPTPDFSRSSNLRSVPGSGPERRVKRFRCFGIGSR